MKKTILIPTDFTVQSLHLIKDVLNKQEDGSVNILFLHGIELSDSITDLMFFSRSKIIRNLENDDFCSAYEFLKNRYEDQLNSIRVDIFTGGVQSVFETYLETAGVDEIYYYEGLQSNNRRRNSIDLLPYIKRSKVHKTAIKWNAELSKKRESEPLAELFFTNNLSS